MSGNRKLARKPTVRSPEPLLLHQDDSFFLRRHFQMTYNLHKCLRGQLDAIESVFVHRFDTQVLVDDGRTDMPSNFLELPGKKKKNAPKSLQDLVERSSGASDTRGFISQGGEYILALFVNVIVDLEFCFSSNCIQLSDGVLTMQNFFMVFFFFSPCFNLGWMQLKSVTSVILKT